jgi:hypothetical protein
MKNDLAMAVMRGVRMGKQLVDLAGRQMGEERVIAQDCPAIDWGTPRHGLRLLILDGINPDCAPIRVRAK